LRSGDIGFPGLLLIFSSKEVRSTVRVPERTAMEVGNGGKNGRVYMHRKRPIKSQFDRLLSSKAPKKIKKG